MSAQPPCHILTQPLATSRDNLSPRKTQRIILRLSRGVYLVPDILPPGGKWGPDRYWILDQLMKHLGANYQITGPEAFNRYGLTEQIPNVTFVYNDRISGRRKIGACQYEFIKVPKERLGGIDKVQTKDKIDIPFPSLARALVDAIYDWSRFNKLPEALEYIRKIKNNPKLLKEILAAAENYGNISTIRRIGFTLEYQSRVPSPNLKSFLRLLPHESQSVIPLYPNKSRKGEINQKWGIIINA